MTVPELVRWAMVPATGCMWTSVGSVVRMRWGRGKLIARLCSFLAVLGASAVLVTPVGADRAQGRVAHVPVDDPGASNGPLDPGVAASEDHPDGGERVTDRLGEALLEATPEELERRRAEVAEQLADAGSAAELARRTESQAAAAMAELDAALTDAQDAVASSEAEVRTATAAVEVAEEEHREAEQRARRAEDDLRSAAVDLFINPPQSDSMRAALSATVEEEMVSTGLLVGRAESRRQLSLRRDRARVAAAKAQRDAENAKEAATEARSLAEQAASELTTQLELRDGELRRIREDLALLEAEVADLELTDSVLQTRLALDGLSQSGSVTAVQGPDGNWVPLTDGLPTRADMVQIGDTGVWVHHLVAPNVTAMFLSALQDGVVLGGSAHRDSTRQIQLRASHCGTSYEALFTMAASSCSPPTARPGQSMHERGLAIDFTEGGRVLNRSSASFLWLSENAADFGFFNLPSEAWHWSVNGR